LVEIIVTKSLSYTYQKGTPFEYQALKDINISILKGEIVGIIGHTGSGKSTLVQHFNSLLQPTSGSIIINGKEINSKTGIKKSDPDICFEVGLVFQYPEYQLFEDTIYDDIAFGPRNMKISESEIENKVRKAMGLMDLDYESFKERSPFSLSGGEMRRVALAGVLAMEPKVLVLDEPAAGLDPKSKEDLFEKLKSLKSELGMTVIMVSHELADIARISDHLIILEKGRIVADDSPSEIFGNENIIEKLNLELPPLMKLMSKIKKSRYDVKTNVLDVQEAYVELQKMLGQKIIPC
jgi:energy-coupling factor transport system ATP-binding protein